MSLPVDTFTLGVEEEYQIVDAHSRALVPRQQRILPFAERRLGEEVQPELILSEIEIATPICSTLADVRAAVLRGRKHVIAAAQRSGSRIAAAGTHPFSKWSEQIITPKDRYQGLARDYQQLARETVIFGFHVHVGIAERDVRIRVMNRVRARLSPLLALAANSPFWLGEDSGYASFRTEVWSRWPLSGPPLPFASTEEYDAVIGTLANVGIIEDATKIYWDVRPSERFPTLEFRVTDVCMSVDEAVMLAGLVRALARTAYLADSSGAPYETVRPEVLRAAHWQAARFGLDGNLVDIERRESVEASAVIGRFVESLRDALEEAGDYEETSALVERVLREGTGAARQRAIYARSGRLEDVVDYVVGQTEKA